MIARRTRAGLLLAIALAFAAGCVPQSNIQPVNALSDVRDGEVLIVGKVVLDPPLRPDEQVLGESYEEYRNAVMLIVDDELRDASSLRYGDLSERIETPFDSTFFVGRTANPFWILQGWVVMHAEVEAVGPGGSVESGNAPLFGVLRVNVQPGDKAIYIGTLRYQRDDFFGTERLEVLDDFATAQAEFRRKFGADVKLRKSLALPLSR